MEAGNLLPCFTTDPRIYNPWFGCCSETPIFRNFILTDRATPDWIEEVSFRVFFILICVVSRTGAVQDNEYRGSAIC